MLRALKLESSRGKRSQLCSHWAATTVLNEWGKKYPDFKNTLTECLNQEPVFGGLIKTEIQQEVQKQFDRMLDYYETSTDDTDCTYCVDYIDGEYIFREVDVEIAYRMGARLSLLEGKAFTRAMIDPEFYDMKLAAFERAFSGKTASYIGRLGEVSFSGRLTPIMEEGKVITVQAVMNFPAAEEKLSENIIALNEEASGKKTGSIIPLRLQHLLFLGAVGNLFLYHRGGFIMELLSHFKIL